MKLARDGAIGSEFFSADELAAAVERLAGEVASAYAGQPLLLLGVLKGALCFTADLSRALAGKANGPSEIVVDYVCVESYGAAVRSSGEVRLTMDAATAVTGRNVLIVDDVADTGCTLAFLRTLLGQRHPATLRTCVILDKPSCRRAAVPLDFVGLSVPDAFVIGYGLDYQELYRNLPYLAELGVNARRGAKALGLMQRASNGKRSSYT